MNATINFNNARNKFCIVASFQFQRTQSDIIITNRMVNDSICINSLKP